MTNRSFSFRCPSSARAIDPEISQHPLPSSSIPRACHCEYVFRPDYYIPHRQACFAKY